MKRVALLTMFFLGVFSYAVVADTSFDKTHEDMCLLENLPGMKLQRTVELVRKACKEVAQTRFRMSRNKEAYYSCLLDHLAGVENAEVAETILDICKRQYLP